VEENLEKREILFSILVSQKYLNFKKQRDYPAFGSNQETA
jgi:hypothetical protein